jgi:hypothetical protein
LVISVMKQVEDMPWTDSVFDKYIE